MRLKPLALYVSAGAFIVAGAFVAYAWEREIPAVATPDPSSFDPELVARGEMLARVGNCNVCHTRPGDAPFAGGLGIDTPFGTIHSTNITPDPETGIGTWSEEAFQRSMHEGVGRGGEHLYPAFPYDHFTFVTPEDNRAIYAYLMTREPATEPEFRNELPFPLNNRLLLAGWKLLFFRPGQLEDDPQHSAEWNHGRYLAEGLAHCAACHTPRNLLGALDRDRQFAGAEQDGWYGYALNRSSPSPIPWDRAAMTFYLQNGWHELHGVSRGTMAPVTANLGGVPESEVAAISDYIVDWMQPDGADSESRAAETVALAEAEVVGPPKQSGDSMIAPPAAQSEGEAIYNATCATCHDAGRPLPQGGLNLHLSTAMYSDNPQNVINVTLFGLPGADGDASAVMPGYMDALDADQMVALLDYMRDHFGKSSPWEDARERVEDTISGETTPSFYRSDGAQATPPASQTRIPQPWR